MTQLGVSSPCCGRMYKRRYRASGPPPLSKAVSHLQVYLQHPGEHVECAIRSTKLFCLWAGFCLCTEGAHSQTAIDFGCAKASGYGPSERTFYRDTLVLGRCTYVPATRAEVDALQKKNDVLESRVLELRTTLERQQKLLDEVLSILPLGQGPRP